MSDSEIVDNIKQKTTWIRGLYMLLFVVLYSIAEIVMLAVIVLQFLFSLLTRRPNTELTRFGMQLSMYMFAVFRFLTFNSEDRPFPFDSWPDADSTAEQPQPAHPRELDDYHDEHEKL